MSNDSAARKVRAMFIGSERHEAEPAGDTTRPPETADAEVIDPDAVIIGEGPAPGDGIAEEDPDVLAGNTMPDDTGTARGRGTTDGGAGHTGLTGNTGPTDLTDDTGHIGLTSDTTHHTGHTGYTGYTGHTDDTGGTSLTDDTGLTGDTELMHERWTAIQSGFVDDPRASVAAAAELAGEAISALVASARERERGLRREWDRDGVDTEGLRHALRSYRGFLDRVTAL